MVYIDRLDGLSSGGKRKRDGEDMAGMEDFLQLPDDYATRMSQPGKKRVSPGFPHTYSTVASPAKVYK